MSDYHNAVHRAVGPDLECKVCKLLEAVSLLPRGEQEAAIDRLLHQFVTVSAPPDLRVVDCDRPCCASRLR